VAGATAQAGLVVKSAGPSSAGEPTEAGRKHEAVDSAQMEEEVRADPGQEAEKIAEPAAVACLAQKSMETAAE
jgi:hypothetical protein